MYVIPAAISLLFLTPGILACDPAEAAQRVTDVEAMASFPPFATFLKTALASTDLGTLVTSDAEFSTLEQACIAEWRQMHPVSVYSAQSRDDIQSYQLKSPIDDVSFYMKDVSTNSNAYNRDRTFKLENDAWRFVEIY